MSTLDRWDELFGHGRRWRVAEELTGLVPADGYHEDRVLQAGVPVAFDHGTFEIPAPGAYRSVLSTNLGRRGVVLQETDATGAKDIPGSRIAIGAPAVRRAREVFGAVW